VEGAGEVEEVDGAGAFRGAAGAEDGDF